MLTNTLWLLFASVLVVITFGSVGCFLLLLSVLVFLVSCITTVFYKGFSRSKELCKEFDLIELYPSDCGIKEVFELARYKGKSSHRKKVDGQDELTGSSIIDDCLNEIINYTIRDFVRVWYGRLTNDEEFIERLRECGSRIVSNFSRRARHVDWVPLLTTRIIDEFASHVRLFRKAKERTKGKGDGDLENYFFDLELEMEGDYCRDLLSTSSQYESAYLRDLCDILLYLLLPEEDFECKPFRFLIREVCVNRVLLEAFKQLSDPDYINQCIVWLLGDVPITSYEFLCIIHASSHLNELTSIRDCLDNEIASKRSKDTGGQGDFLIKQQLNSLIYVRKLIEVKIRRLEVGSFRLQEETAENVPKRDSSQEPSLYYDLPLEFILDCHISLCYFIDFLTQVPGGLNLINLFLAIGGFKTSAQQRISAAGLGNKSRRGQANIPELDIIREAAQALYDQYLCVNSPNRIGIEESVIRKVGQNIKSAEPSHKWFDQVQTKLFDILKGEQYYVAFKKSTAYTKMLQELDYKFGSASEIAVGTSDDAPESVPGDAYVELEQDYADLELFLRANIVQIGMERYNNRAFAIYVIRVSQETSNGDIVSQWTIQRRYSDFHALNMKIMRQCPSLVHEFPGKKTFNNLTREFLERRRKALNGYLQSLLLPDILELNPELASLITQFLSKGSYSNAKPLSLRKVDSFNFMMPLLAGARSAMISVPDTLFGGVYGLSRMTKQVISAAAGSGMSLASRPSGQMLDSPEGRVGASVLDLDNGSNSETNNIPLRIMLLLMDEVFNLRQRNQWFRRRLVAFLQGLIRATFGSSINKKIVDFVSFLTSENQVAEYVKAFKNSFWPNGFLGESYPERSLCVQMRTRVVVKSKMLAALPDQLRLFLGNETAKTGILLVFEAFQNSHLNKRFCYVLLEQLLRTIFPENNFDDIIRKLHSKSPRCKSKSASAVREQLRT